MDGAMSANTDHEISPLGVVNTTQAAKLCGCSRDYLFRLHRAGRLPGIVIKESPDARRSKRLWRVKDLQAFLDSHVTTTGEEIA
jgi:hypothetical protein